VYDLDGTLAKSKAPLDDEMAGLLRDLMAVAKVAIISGGDLPQFQSQVIEQRSIMDRDNHLAVLLLGQSAQ